MTQFLYITALPAEDKRSHVHASPMLLNVDRIEMIRPTDQGTTVIDLIKLPDEEPAGVEVAETFAEVVAQLGLKPSTPQQRLAADKASFDREYAAARVLTVEEQIERFGRLID